MKIIEVSDEMYTKLMDISNELTTQDNRCTAMPYFFQVQETRKGPAHDGCGDEVWYNPECQTEVMTKEEMVEWLCEDDYQLSTHIKEPEDVKKKFESMDDWDIDDLIQEKGFQKFHEQNNNEYSNAFFTSKGCDEHIRINGHNLHNPINYLSHAYRNSEMELMFEFLCGLSGKQMHK